MKISERNRIHEPTGKPYITVFVGDILFFGGKVQKYYEVTHMEPRTARPFHNEIDLWELWKTTNELPIVFEK